MASVICWGNLVLFHPGISAGRTSLSPTFIKLPVQLMFLFFTDSSHYPSSLSFIRVSHIPLAGLYCISVGGWIVEKDHKSGPYDSCDKFQVLRSHALALCDEKTEICHNSQMQNRHLRAHCARFDICDIRNVMMQFIRMLKSTWNGNFTFAQELKRWESKKSQSSRLRSSIYRLWHPG